MDEFLVCDVVSYLNPYNTETVMAVCAVSSEFLSMLSNPTY